MRRIVQVVVIFSHQTDGCNPPPYGKHGGGHGGILPFSILFQIELLYAKKIPLESIGNVPELCDIVFV